MARVFTQAEAKQLGLSGRKALEIVSGERGSRGVTLRLAEIPVPQPGETPRGPHQHHEFEECIYVLSGIGTKRKYILRTRDVGAGHEEKNVFTFCPASARHSPIAANFRSSPAIRS